MSDFSSIIILGAPKLEQALSREGLGVVRLETPENVKTLEIGSQTRLVILDGQYLGDSRMFDMMTAIQERRPYLDVLVFKPGADAAYVHSVLKNGASDVIFEDSHEKLHQAIEAIQTNQRVSTDTKDFRHARKEMRSFEGILSRNGVMWDIFQTIVRTASSDATVLIVGETGTGKDLLARAIHRQSGRTGRFVAVNCSTINPEIIESELFGHERGAFTGAHQQKQGLFRYADGGTILLDEIGDMPVQTQLSLLRVLQEQTVRPVGSHHEVPIDARVIAATNASLANAVQTGTFREDLFYRLDVIRLEVPPLRERREDILYLFGHFLKRVCADYGMECPELHQSFMDLLLEQSWPGNVRQLENLTQRLVLKGHTRELTAEDLTEVLYSQEIPGSSSLSLVPETETVAQPIPSQGDDSASIHSSVTLADYLEPHLSILEKEYLETVLSDNKGRIAESADQAGVSRRTLLRKLKAYQINKQSFRKKNSESE
ncbi:MAG: sigma-54 interaction domain-containing protein [Nitrospirales bacterium]